jgi:hypothetical protein
MFRRIVLQLAVISLLICLASASYSAEKPLLYAKDNVLAVGIYNNATTSSDLTLVVRADVDGETIFDEGYEIAYTIPTKDINDWNTAKFDASGWKKGVSGIGYADGDDNTTTPSSLTCLYVRYYFDVPNVKDVREITFWVDYDDAYILWLNDVEVGRSDNIGAKVAVGKVPSWNQILGIVDHESTDTAAGKPNATRWTKAVGPGASQIMKHTAEYDFGGDQQKNVGAKPTGADATVGTAKLFLQNNVLAAGIYNNATSSSDLSLIVRADVGGKTIFDEGYDIVYTIPTENINDWTTIKFNDSGWEKGTSGIGYADADDNTTTPAGITCVYVRYNFDVPNAKDGKEFTFWVDYDDAYILWLNGVEVGRSSNIGAKVADGEIPSWNQILGITDHESTDTAAGKPNAARWAKAVGTGASQIMKHTAKYDYGGGSAQPVESAGKLTSTWGKIKKI